MINYNPSGGVCAVKIMIELDGDYVKEVRFVGGCDGNAQGVARLVKGMKIDDVIKRLKGIRCGYKPTSCPDQLAIALQSAKNEQTNN